METVNDLKEKRAYYMVSYSAKNKEVFLFKFFSKEDDIVNAYLRCHFIKDLSDTKSFEISQEEIKNYNRILPNKVSKYIIRLREKYNVDSNELDYICYIL